MRYDNPPGSGKIYSDVQAYRTASGQGTHTNLFGDFITPSIIDNALNNPVGGDLTLKAGSVFVDKGTPVPNIADQCGVNFTGSAPDLGATEGLSNTSCPSSSCTATLKNCP